MYEKGLKLGDSAKCSIKFKCGEFTASVPWARHNSRFTKEFEELAAWLSLVCTKTAVAALLRISWNTIGSIISRVRADLDVNPSERFDGLARIGVDETSYKKGHKYITTVINHIQARLSGYMKDTAKRFSPSFLSC